MTQNENTGILGVSLVDSQFRFVEGVKKSADEFQVTQVAHGRSREPFNYDVFLDKSMPRRFAEDITRLYRTQSFNFDRVAFSLDSTMVMVKKLSLDSQLKQEFWRNHVTWEVEQFAISPAEEYVIDFEALASEKNGDVANVLVVVVRKKIVNFLKEVFKHTELKLAVIDVDIFSAQRALQINYDYGHNQIVCLVKVEEKKVQFTILKGRNFFLTQDVAIPSTSSARENSDSVVRLIAKELRRIVLDYQLGKQVDDLNELFLYGEAVDDSLLESLQNSYDVHINRANPFRRIKLASQPPEDTNSMHAERYLISVGAALRGIQ